MSYVFDVDGTLTPSRKKIDPDFLSFMLDFADKYNVYFVTGSDRDKTLEQIGLDLYNAAKRVSAILKGEKKENHFLRVSVTNGGCSGMSYNLTFDDKEEEFDKIYISKGVRIVCDIKSWFYVKGTEIDFSDDLLSGGFQLKNPNANKTCGCGTSFSA